MIAIEEGKIYRAKVTLRRDDKYVVREEAERFDGETFIFTAGYVLTANDATLYVNEWAMLIASGDLSDVEDVTDEMWEELHDPANDHKFRR